ncbi:MAG: SPOR domain-containing protein [Melioribacteraceae bacterium]|nr:SPOR domain-containing protein [Melioribacteraceae bacterium]
MRLFKILFLLLIFNFVNAQSISSDWTPIISDEESTLYLNSSKIIGYGNEISVWVIEKFEETSKSNMDEKISKIKTHYLFDKMKKRYAEVGIIYYDNKGKIINRSSKSNFQATSAAFMTPIQSDPKVEIIYKEVISFLITGDIVSIVESDEKENDNANMEIPSVHRQLAEKQKEDVQLSINKDSVPEKIAPIEKAPNSSARMELAVIKASEKGTDAVDLTKESWTDIPIIEERLEITEKPTIVSVTAAKEFNKIYDSINIQEPVRSEYNSNNERALKNAIFTDGNLYCFQVSSWKTKAYADRELNKLLSDGYNAFIISVKPKHKRSIWHRVRVGYFNSLKEVKSVQRLVGKR